MQLNYSKILPLDGSPMMSSNCWDVILDSLTSCSQQGGVPAVLEWGAGNSTVGFVRHSLKNRNGINLTSIEHETNFFHWLAESLVTELKDDQANQISLVWKPLSFHAIPPANILSVLKRHKNLESKLLILQMLLNTKRFVHVEGISPSFSFSGIKLFKNSLKYLGIKLNHLLWCVDGLLNYIFRKFEKSSDNINFVLGNSPFDTDDYKSDRHSFFDFFEKHPTPGCLQITKDNITINLWHLPKTSYYHLSSKSTLEGLVKQFPSYVEVPLKKYDLIFIDGRARTACIKRVHQDQLLADEGTLFVHDAFRMEMYDIFPLFTDSPCFIAGKNITKNGNVRCHEEFGAPFIYMGEKPSDFERMISQELFVYKNGHVSQKNN